MKIRLLLFFFVGVTLLMTSAAAQQLTVEEVVKTALQKNYDVLLSENAAATAANDYRYSTGGFLPTLNATGTQVTNSQDQHQEFDPSNPAFASNPIREGKGIKSAVINSGLQLSWTLFDGTKMFSVRNRLSAQNELGLANVKNQMNNTVASVITNYFNVVRQKQQLKAIQELIEVNNERVKLAEKKLQVGTGGKPELLQARVDLNAQRTLALQQETLIQQLKDQLNGLLGMSLPDGFDVADTIPINLNITLNDVVGGFEQQSPILKVAATNVNIARLSLKERRAERFPVINFVSAYSYSKTDNLVVLNKNLPLLSRFNGYNYGFSISLPILNGFNQDRLIQNAMINHQRQQLVYDQQKNAAFVLIRNGFTNYENSKRILILQEENILLAKENVTIALEGFRRGITTYIELRTAQQALSDAFSQLIAARYNAKAAETELMRLKGSLLE